MNTENKPPAPPAAGPVWVKAVTFLPIIKNQYFLRRPDGNGYHGWYQWVNPAIIDKNVWIEEGWEWLDEIRSAPAHHVFNREQVEEILTKWHDDFKYKWVVTKLGILEWFNTNYPV